MDKSVLRPIYRLLTKSWKKGSPQLQQKSKYYYRRLLIEVPESLNTTLERQTKVEEIKFMFREAQEIESIEEIELLHGLCEEILSKVRSGEYPPFPHLVEDETSEILFEKRSEYYNVLVNRLTSIQTMGDHRFDDVERKAKKEDYERTGMFFK